MSNWIRLPGNVRVADVASVIGRLLGRPAHLEDLGGGAKVARVEGVRVRGTSMPECAAIVIEGVGEYLFHFEDPCGRRLISLSESREGRAIGLALVAFFGGVLEDEHGETLARGEDRTADENHAQDGAPWDAFQRRILEVAPVTASAKRIEKRAARTR